MQKVVIVLSAPSSVEIPPVAEMHIHPREGTIRSAVVGLVSPYVQAVVAMLNYREPVTVCDLERWELERDTLAEAFDLPLERVLPAPLLTDDTSPDDIRRAAAAGVRVAKLYPRGVTTNSSAGVTNIYRLSDTFAAMEEAAIILSVHGEKPGSDVAAAEVDYLDEFLWVVETFPGLKIVLEHVSTVEAIQAVATSGDNVAATITPHHLRLTKEDVFGPDGEVDNPDNFCKPVAKTGRDRFCLALAATGESGKFFMGGDFAAHLAMAKDGPSPAAGCANYPAALPVLAEVFEFHNALRKLGEFTSGRAARFYGLDLSRGPGLVLYKDEFTVPERIYTEICLDGACLPHRPPPEKSYCIRPWLAGQTLSWSVRPISQ